MDFLEQLRVNADKYQGNRAAFKVGFEKLANGEIPCFSTGICGSTTVGYGKLDWNGYFEYPLPVDLLDGVFEIS
jgi:hypothetical protein